MTTAFGRLFGGGGRDNSRRSFRQQLARFWQRQFSRGELTVLIIAIGLLLMPALSLSAAGWDVMLRVVVPVLVLSVLFGFLLARSYYNEFIALLMGLVYGACFVLLAAAFNEPGSLTDGVYRVFARVVLWIYDAANGGVNQDPAVFTLLVASLFWFLGYNIAWHVFRFEQIHVFRVVLPPGIILIVNTVYYQGDAPLTPYLVVYTFLALVLAVRSYLEAREWEWYTSGIRVPTKVRRQFNLVGSTLALFAVTVGWLLPAANLQNRLDNFREMMQQNPQQFAEIWNRLFSTIDAYGPVTADYYGGERLELSGAIQLGNQVVMQVQAPPGRRYYWRSRVFDTYDNGNWTSQRTQSIPGAEAPFTISQPPDERNARTPVQQTYTMALNASRLVYAAPQPSQINLSVDADIRFTNAPQDDLNLYVARPASVLERGDTYTVTSQMSTATAEQLRAAGDNYPQWVRDTQLYVPGSVTGRTLVLAREIVEQAGAVTPYDKARAIESWLRQNITYDESIPQPPRGQDPVDWVLFDYQRGYCNYYASAMVLMLRAQGIPARMGAGFAQGEYDGTSYVVREREAHTWVEVYFPGYGWIEFEPTAAESPIPRGDEPQPTEPPATNTPVPTSTPAATATPTVTNTPPPSETPNATDQASQDIPPEFPTPTPTPSPTPTATPVVVPTAEPPMPPQQTGLLGMFFTAVQTLLIGLLVVVLFAVVAAIIWWWWEWRGFRDASPAVRAYGRLERYVTGLLRLPLGEQQTTFERQEQILDSLPKNANRPVRAITSMYTQERYGRGPGNDDEIIQHATSADKAWKRTRENILERWLYRVFPFLRWFRAESE